MRLLNACFSWFVSWPYRWYAIALVALMVIVTCRAGCNHQAKQTDVAPLPAVEHKVRTGCVVEYAALRKSPDDKSEQITQVVAGEPVQVLEEGTDWFFVLAAHYRKEGWVKATSIGDIGNDKWLIAEGGNAVDKAKSYLGAPYEWGGMTSHGIDCSGLVHMSLRRAYGMLIPRDASEQETYGKPVAWTKLRPGDLITYGGKSNPKSGKAVHVAFWLGNGMILNSRRDTGVIVEREPKFLIARRRVAVRIGNFPAVTAEKAPMKITAKTAAKLVPPTEIKGLTKLPKMPLLPTAKGPLSGMIVVIDPGHGGTDCGAPWAEQFSKCGPRVQFFESSYTYKMAWELSDLVRKNGGTVYLTAYSRMMDQPQPSCQVSLAEPTDARYLMGGAGVTASNLAPRTAMANFALRHKGKAKAVVFIAIHINSATIKTDKGEVEKNNQRGSFVVVRDPNEAPRLALVVGQTMEVAGYHRLVKNKAGQWEPASNVTRERMRLWVLRDDKNLISGKILVEFAEPSMDNESYRMRSATSRKMMLQKCIVNGLVKYLQGVPKKN